MVQVRRKQVIPQVEAYKRVRALCLSLPGTTETTSWGHPNFRARGKAYVALETHQARPSIAFRLVSDQVRELCEDGTFFATPYGKGIWASIYADRRLNWRLIQSLIRQSYNLPQVKT
jgi:predicted DNA-binding protein (MmcQ/YjbR family)